MTYSEFQAWKEVTRRSEGRWQMDLIQYANRGEYLFYKGGEDGVFVQVDATGKIERGTYEGALPHIGEAGFKIESEKQHCDQKTALRNLYQAVPELKGAVTGLTGRV
jgi:hypothetical protein